MSIWFILIGVLFTGYAVIDLISFTDLGVGALHLFTNKDDERRVMLNAIGPVWDGNEVWLVTGGGAQLFAVFPSTCVCDDILRFLSGFLFVARRADFSRGRDRIPQQASGKLVAECGT